MQLLKILLPLFVILFLWGCSSGDSEAPQETADSTTPDQPKAETENKIPPAPGIEPLPLWEGYYTFGHETNTFQPCGTIDVYWVKADAAIQSYLQSEYEKLAERNYDQMFVQIHGEKKAPAKDGFAANYDHIFEIQSVALFRRLKDGDCRNAKNPEAGNTGEDPATMVEFSGSYSAQLASASSPGRIITMTFSGENTVEIKTDFLNDKPAIVEKGFWHSLHNDVFKIDLNEIITASGARPMKETLSFKREGNKLIAVGNHGYGSEGLTLEKK